MPARKGYDNEVAPHGWRVDQDSFYVRRRRVGDPAIPDGYAYLGFTFGSKVYLRKASQARAYDAGILEPRS